MARSIFPRWIPIYLISLSAGAIGCVDSQTDSVEAIEDLRLPIIDGTREREEDMVIMFAHWTGGGCTGTAIAPRVVLTAKHCVIDMEGSGGDLEPSGFTVAVGADFFSFFDEYGVEEVRRTPGSDLYNSDIALLILDRDFEHGFKRWEFTPWPGVERNATITAIGYGMTRAGDEYSAGTKYRRDGRVADVGPNEMWGLGDREMITQGENTCQGDSGGPILFEDVIVGIVSRGDLGCTGFGVVTRVSGFTDMVISALEDTGACVPQSFEVCNGVDDNCWEGVDEGLGETCGCADGAPPSDEVCDGIDNDCDEEIDDLEDCGCTGGAEAEEEVCDGVDNDCNGEIDETCQRLGEPCGDDDECASGMCEEINGDEVCTAECVVGGDPCPDDGYCDGPPCDEGICRVSHGDLRIGEDCSEANECGSGFCAAPDGEQSQCARPCTVDAVSCFVTEICASIDGDCGLCSERPSGETSGLGFGEPCLDDDECRSERCFTDGDEDDCGDGCTYRYCSERCEEDGDCPEMAHCRGEVCVRGPASEIGQPCIHDDDCLDGRCVEHDGVSLCVEDCDDDECDDEFDCVDDEFCWPDGLPLGARCEDDEECNDGVCTEIVDQQICTSSCDHGADCPSGLSCIPSDDGLTGLCVPSSIALEVDEEDDDTEPQGCQCSAVGAPRHTAALGLLFVAAATLRFRR